MKVVAYIVVFVVIVAIRVGIRMLLQGGNNAIGGGTEPTEVPAHRSCPHCGSNNVTTSGASVYCFACNKSA